MTNHAGELGVVTIDRAATIQSWNHWMASATGVSENEVRGCGLLSVITPARAEVFRAFLDEVLSTGTSRVLAPAFHHCLIPCPPRQPSPHFTEMQQFVTIAPLRSEETIVGAMLTIEDVTPRLDRQRDLMAELERSNAASPTPGAVEAVGAGDWKLRGIAVRNLRQRATTAEIAHLLDALRRGYHDFNVVSSALQVLAANRDVTSPLIDLLSDPQADLRMHAALALGHVGDPVAVPALIAALDDEEPNVRFHVIEALGAIGASDAVDRLAEVARSGDFFLAFPAITALGRTDDPRVGPALTSLLDNEFLRPAVVETLAEIGDEDAVAPLVGVLNSGVADTETVAAIAAALQRIRAREDDSFAAGPHIVDLARAALRPAGIGAMRRAAEQHGRPFASLIAVLSWSGAAGLDTLVAAVGNPDVADEVAEALISIGSRTVEPLIDRLAQGDRASRIASASLLGSLGDARAVPALIAALDGADGELTTAAAAALARLGDPCALDALLALFGHEQTIVRQAAIAAVNAIGAGPTAVRIRPLLDDPDHRVRACAVRVAGYFGFEECVPALLRRTDDSDEEVRRAAIEQLPMLEDPRAEARLIDVLSGETARNRAAAAHALRQVEGVAATEALRQALRDEDAWVRYFAVGSIAPRVDIETVPALAHLAQSDSAPHVRLAALRTLTLADAAIAGEIAVPLVADPNPEVAAAALTAVACGSHADADRLLEKAITSDDPFMRRAAVQALPARSSRRAAELLASAAGLDDSPDLARLLIDSLARMAADGDAGTSSTAVAALINLGSTAETRDPALRTIAALPERVVGDVAVALESSHTRTKLTAIEALARMRHPRASEALRTALQDEEPAVRRAAIAAFGRLGTTTAAPAIRRLSTSDPDERVRRLAEAICLRHAWQEGRQR
ncbi:MAG TPA: HEAT repeat domain-containing protein [Vicinamibacterales bacterium]|nr:HEAT repeat domain-containing protein [Vicinamibacterales bacterium]